MTSMSATLETAFGFPPHFDVCPIVEILDEAASTEKCQILIIDDDPLNIRVVRKYLENYGFRRFVTTTDATRATELIERDHPDLVLLDIVMPGIDGLELLRQIRADETTRFLPVLVLTAATNPALKFHALELGATDFLAKPVDPSELVSRVRNALTVKAHQDHLQNYADQLEREVHQRTEELLRTQREVIHCLARAGEYRDNETGNHVIRVGLYTGVIARALGMPESEVRLLEQASLLHDVGKIGVSDLILLKPGQLTDAEFAQMKRHCEFGRDIIQPRTRSSWCDAEATVTNDLVLPTCTSPMMEKAAIIAYTHHEHWDGTGYPRGLAGEEIPIEGRITSVADVYDALSSERPYKPAYRPDVCFRMMRQGRGTQFDPRVFDAFLESRDDIVRIQHEFADSVSDTPVQSN